MPIEFISAEQYHADTGRVSKSHLDLIARSPAHYWAAINGERAEPSKAMRVGTALHALALEGRAPIVRPKFSGKGAVAARAEWDAAHEGALVLDDDDAQAVEGMAAALLAHSLVGPALRRADGRAEATLKWDRDGVGCKARADWLIPGAIVDLKTTDDASAEAFARSVARYRYHVQDAWYSDGAKECGLGDVHFLFFAIEKKAPYAVGVYQLDPESQQVGRRLADRDFRRLVECRERGEWPAYSNTIEVLTLPRWAANMGEEQ